MTGEFIEVVMGEAPLKAAMIRYGLDILGLSILISIITAALVYLSLDALLVKPMTKLTWNIVRFSERPEDPTRIIDAVERAATRSAPPSASSPPCRHELAETLSQKIQARRARPRREQDQPRSAQHAVERAASLRPPDHGQGSRPCSAWCRS